MLQLYDRATANSYLTPVNNNQINVYDKKIFGNYPAAVNSNEFDVTA